MSNTYYSNSCKYYWDTLQEIAEEKKMAKKLDLGLQIPEFFYFYTRKIGMKKVENPFEQPKRKGYYEGSFFKLVRFITSLEDSGKNKEQRLEEFRDDEESWYTQELLRIIAEQKVAIGIGKQKLKDIADGFVPLRRPSMDEEYDPDDDYEGENLAEIDPEMLEPLEEAELYQPHVMLAKSVDVSKLKVKFPAMVQKKYDGTRRLVFHTGNNIFYKTRQGKNNLVPKQIENAMEKIYEVYKEPFVLDGEFFVPGLPRAESNGIANKKDIVNQDKLVLAAWDFFPLELYNNIPELEKINYARRFNKLRTLLEQIKKKDKNIEFPIIAADTWQVEDLEDAFDLVEELIKSGEEGGVLKDYNLTFKDGRSDLCVKLKAKYDCTLVVVGINPGEGKFSGTIGSLIAESSDGKLQVSVSGMTDEVRNIAKLGKQADKYWIGSLIRVTFLELNKSNSSGYYTLHSPQFDGFNEDVEEADDLKTIEAIASGKTIDKKD